MDHTHEWIRFGGTLKCVCGASATDPRTEAQRTLDRKRSTIAAAIRLNAKMGHDSPELKARLAELG
jgi:hypothetical protein